MIATPPAFNSAQQAPAASWIALIELQLSGGPLRLCTWGVTRSEMGHTWIGSGDVIEVPEIKESEDGNRRKFRVSLTQVKSSDIAIALANPDTYQGRAISMWVLLCDANGKTVDAPQKRIAGIMDMVSTEMGDDGVGKISLDCYTNAQGARPNLAALRENDARHQARFPGQLLYAYQSDLIAKPQPWLSRAMQMQ